MALLALTVVVVAVPTTAFTYVFGQKIVLLFPTHYKVVEKNVYKVGARLPSEHAEGSGQASIEVHSTVKQWRWIDGEKYLIYSYSHPAALTEIGENYTAAKIAGAVFPTANFTANVTYSSLGTDVGLSTSSTSLPGEWNRSTSITPEYLAVGQWNYTFSFYPSGSGTTNATGLHWGSGIGSPGDLWAYDTFSDISYTSNDQIDVEWSIDVQYS